MNRLDSPTQNGILISDDAFLPKLETAHRLIVLIPANMDCSAINHRVWKLARETDSSVQLLALYKDSEQEPSIRRELATMSALLRDAGVFVEIKIEKGNNWIKAVDQSFHNGDMVVCVAEQPVGIQQRPLSQILESDLKIPVYILSEFPVVKYQQTWLKQLTAWFGFMGIIAGFSILQWKVVQFQKDPVQTILLIVLLISEFWLISTWNSIFS